MLSRNTGCKATVKMDKKCLGNLKPVISTNMKWIVLSFLFSYVQTEKQTEFCQDEHFIARCAEDEVIRMKSAHFGRMELKRCVWMDHGYIGCFTDVLYIMDNLCSGQTTCEFRIIDSELKKQSNRCPPDIESYLEVEYDCLQAATADRDVCYTDREVSVGGTDGILASFTTLQEGIGNQQCPWKITVDGGQTIRLHLLSFGQFDEQHTPAGACYEIVKISENGEEKVVLLCPDTDREIKIYESRTNSVSIELSSHDVLEKVGYFLIKYEAMGCADLPPTKATTVKRDGDNLIVRCNSTDQTWYLVCRGTEWIGKLDECTDPLNVSQTLESKDTLPLGILLVVALGVALGVFLGGLLLIIAHLHMKRRREEKARHNQYMAPHDAEFMHTENTLDQVSDCAQCTLERAKDSYILQQHPEYQKTCQEEEKLRDLDSKEYTAYIGKAAEIKQIQRTNQNAQSNRPDFYERPRFV